MVAATENHENGTNGNDTQIARRQQPREVRIVEDFGPNANLLDTARFEHLCRLAGMMARSSLLPDHLVYVGGKPDKGQLKFEEIQANCFRIVDQALRWQFDPFAIIDETYVVGGKLGYSGKLVAAVVNTRAGLSGRLSAEFSGEGENRKVTIYGTFEGENEPRPVELVFKDAKTFDKQGKVSAQWTRDPDQKLIYSASIKWARRHCPEVILGVLTDDDLERIEASRKETIYVDQEGETKSDRLAGMLEAKKAKTEPEKPADTVVVTTEHAHEPGPTGEESNEVPFEPSEKKPEGPSLEAIRATILDADSESLLSDCKLAADAAFKARRIKAKELSELQTLIKKRQAELLTP